MKEDGWLLAGLIALLMVIVLTVGLGFYSVSARDREMRENLAAAGLQQCVVSVPGGYAREVWQRECQQ